MSSKTYGYARVSSKEQNLERQISAIMDYCKKNNIEISERDIIFDKASGKNFNRDGYKLLTEQLLRNGDTLVIKELDRLGRNMMMVKEEWDNLVKKGINIIVIETPMLNTTNKTDLEKSLIANIVFELLAYMAEKERIKINQRQKEGIKLAKEKGKHLGRPNAELPNEFIVLYDEWKKGKITAKQVMDNLGLKRTTFYKLVKIYEILLDLLKEIEVLDHCDFELNKTYSKWNTLDTGIKIGVGKEFKKRVSLGAVPNVTSLGKIKRDNYDWYRKA